MCRKTQCLEAAGPILPLRLVCFELVLTTVVVCFGLHVSVQSETVGIIWERENLHSEDLGMDVCGD